MKKPGYWVEGVHFGTRYAQALARASHLAKLYGRAVNVTRVDHVGFEEVEQTCIARRNAPVKVERGYLASIIAEGSIQREVGEA